MSMRKAHYEFIAEIIKDELGHSEEFTHNDIEHIAKCFAYRLNLAAYESFNTSKFLKACGVGT